MCARRARRAPPTHLSTGALACQASRQPSLPTAARLLASTAADSPRRDGPGSASSTARPPAPQLGPASSVSPPKPPGAPHELVSMLLSSALQPLNLTPLARRPPAARSQAAAGSRCFRGGGAPAGAPSCAQSHGACSSGAAAGTDPASGAAFSWYCPADSPVGSAASGAGTLCWDSAQSCLGGLSACSDAPGGVPCSEDYTLCSTGAAGGLSAQGMPHAFACPLDRPEGAVPNGRAPSPRIVFHAIEPSLLNSSLLLIMRLARQLPGAIRRFGSQIVARPPPSPQVWGVLLQHCPGLP